MKTLRHQPKRRELTDTEKAALRNIDEGTLVDADLCEHLKRHGLVELKENVWATTEQGHFQLMFQRAR
jgi:hypothetical protein